MPALFFFSRQQLDNVGVVELAQGFPFPHEAGHPVGVAGADRGFEDLDGHRGFGLAVRAPINGAHAPLAQQVGLQVGDGVAPGDDFLRRGRLRRRRGGA